MEPSLNSSLPADREKLRRLLIVKKTECEMMTARGFTLEVSWSMKSNRSFVPINLSSLNKASLNEFLHFRNEIGLFGSRQEFSCVYVTTDMSRKVLVLYLSNSPGKDVDNKDFQIVRDFIRTQEYHHIIIVTESGLGTDSSSFIRNQTAGYNIEVFLDKELAYNKTKHALAPITIMYIPKDRVKDWAEEEQVQPEKLPMLLTSDSIAKYYGARPLDVFQLEILGTSTDTVGFYRISRTPATK